MFDDSHSERVSFEALLRTGRSKVEISEVASSDPPGAMMYMPNVLLSRSRRRRVFPVPAVLKRIEVDASPNTSGLLFVASTVVGRAVVGGEGNNRLTDAWRDTGIRIISCLRIYWSKPIVNGEIKLSALFHTDSVTLTRSANKSLSG